MSSCYIVSLCASLVRLAKSLWSKQYVEYTPQVATVCTTPLHRPFPFSWHPALYQLVSLQPLQTKEVKWTFHSLFTYTTPSRIVVLVTTRFPCWLLTMSRFFLLSLHCLKFFPTRLVFTAAHNAEAPDNISNRNPFSWCIVMLTYIGGWNVFRYVLCCRQAVTFIAFCVFLWLCV